ncbi:MAG: RAD55 family ATPase, partial [Nitrososphaerales archaeon]
MKKEHPDWNFCPTCNASLREVKKVEVFGIFLTHADNKFVISISLSPDTGTGVVSPFSMGEVNRFPVWAEAMQLGSPGLSKERLFEETIVQHVLPAFRNGFKISRFNCTAEDQHLFTKIFMKYAQRDLAEKSVRQISSEPDDMESKPKKFDDEGNTLFDTHRSIPPFERSESGFRSPNMITSGIAGFDRITNGGLPKRKVTLISGPSGLGKTIFALQFLIEGAKRSEVGVLALTDHRPIEVIEEAESLGIPLVTAIREKKIFLIVLDPRRTYEAKGIQIVTAKNEAKFLKILEDIVTRRNAKRIVIDSLTALISANKKEEQEQQQDVKKKIVEVTDLLDRLQTTVVATGHLQSGTRSLTYFGVEENFVAGLIVLRTTSIAGKVVRHLFVPKMKGTDHNLQKFVYDIEPRTGLSVTDPLKQYLSQGRLTSSETIRDALQIANVLKSLALVNVSPPEIVQQTSHKKVEDELEEKPRNNPSGISYAKQASKQPPIV